MFEILFKSILVGYSGAVMPGTLLTYTIDKSLKHGAKSGILISIGHSLLELALIILILLGFGEYLGTELAKAVIGIAGGLILIILGAGMLKDSYENKLNINFESSQSNKFNNLLVGGAVISVLNPYFTFWWAAVGMGFIMNAYSLFGIAGVIAFYIGHITADISWYSFVSIVISKTRSFINLKMYRMTIAFLGVCMLGFGLSFIINSLYYFT